MLSILLLDPNANLKQNQPLPISSNMPSEYMLFLHSPIMFSYALSICQPKFLDRQGLMQTNQQHNSNALKHDNPERKNN